MKIHFQKLLILHEILTGPRCVMVPVGSLACLKTSTNNSERRNIHRSHWLDSQYAEGFLVQLPFGVHSRMAIWLNLAKSCNYYHPRVTVSTSGTERAHDVGSTLKIGCICVATSVNVYTTSLQRRIVDVVMTSKMDVVTTLI